MDKATFQILHDFDLESLDIFDKNQYLDNRGTMSKEEALKAIIDNAEGDYSQLSSSLAEIAQVLDEQ
jgi:DNA polymerase III delta prime subunit